LPHNEEYFTSYYVKNLPQEEFNTVPFSSPAQYPQNPLNKQEVGWEILQLILIFHP